jgi:hypothetical protein
MIPFKTVQRLSVMLFKTTVGYNFGCLQGSLGPASCSVPEIGSYIDEPERGWRVYRLSEDIMFLTDHYAETAHPFLWARFIIGTHGLLLRQLGKIRVIYLLRVSDATMDAVSVWHSNINLVTGVSIKWLDERFRPADSTEKCVIAGV